MQLDSCFNEYTRKPILLRRKLSQKDMSDGAEMAALAHYIYQQTLSTTPLKADLLEATYISAFRLGSDATLALEVSGILLEKPDVVNLERITIIKDHLMKHTKALGGSPSTIVLASSLEEDQFPLLSAGQKPPRCRLRGVNRGGASGSTRPERGGRR